MYNLLVKLMLIAAVGKLGMSLIDIENCDTRECRQRVERRSRDVLAIEWRPISVFPEEAKRFR
jgi:hypothetical protein